MGNITFGELSTDGKLTDVKVMDQNIFDNCPYVIFMPEHYREDGTCKCNDPNELIMKDWGYTWNGKCWS